MKMQKLAIMMLGGAILMAGSGDILATTTKSSALSITASVPANCNVGSIAPLAFNSYDATTGGPYATTDDTAQTSVSVTCTKGTAYHIIFETTGTNEDTGHVWYLDAGQTLSYGLFTDTNHTVILDDQTINEISGTGTGSPIPYTIYGDIPKGQTTAAVQSDTDSLTLDVTY